LTPPYQNYGTPTRAECYGFAVGYVLNNLPPAQSSSSPADTRARYVFAITPTSPSIKPYTTSDGKGRGKKRLGGGVDGYVGNMAIEMEDAEGNAASSSVLPARKRGVVFEYPSAEELKEKVIGRAFYELHPDYWSLGLTTSALSLLLSFAFTVLCLPCVIIDPRSSNTASIALVKRAGGRYLRTFVNKEADLGRDDGNPGLPVMQEEWEVDREGWLRKEGIEDKARGNGGKRTRCCRWYVLAFPLSLSLSLLSTRLCVDNSRYPCLLLGVCDLTLSPISSASAAGGRFTAQRNATEQTFGTVIRTNAEVYKMTAARYLPRCEETESRL
jgi:hypothetical protein